MTQRAPLVPPEVDLTVYKSMPLEFERLFQSDTWVLGTPEQRVACIYLWCKSWHQVPAASLPNDDRILAEYSRAGARWKKMKEHCMRGWMLCSDGRWYHPVVAEKALDSWDKLLINRQRGKNSAAKRVINASLGLNLDESPGETPRATIEGKGIEGKEKHTPPPPFQLPDWIDKAAWDGFVEMRRLTKDPLTPRAMDLTVKKLSDLKAGGHDPNSCLDQSTQRGWSGVFPVHKDSGAPGRQNALESRNRAAIEEAKSRAGS